MSPPNTHSKSLKEKSSPAGWSSRQRSSNSKTWPNSRGSLATTNSTPGCSLKLGSLSGQRTTSADLANSGPTRRGCSRGRRSGSNSGRYLSSPRPLAGSSLMAKGGFAGPISKLRAGTPSPRSHLSLRPTCWRLAGRVGKVYQWLRLGTRLGSSPSPEHLKHFSDAITRGNEDFILANRHRPVYIIIAMPHSCGGSSLKDAIIRITWLFVDHLLP